MNTAHFVITICLAIVLLIAVVWWLENRRQRYIKSLVPGDSVLFQFENSKIFGTITEKHAIGFVIFSDNRSYHIANDRIFVGSGK